jgi:hypothetical protein
MPKQDKYVPLGAHLRRLAADHSDVTLTFVEIERIIDARLPQGARAEPFWIGANGKPPPRARAWLNEGFIAQPDAARERVRFHRQAAPARRPDRR